MSASGKREWAVAKYQVSRFRVKDSINKEKHALLTDVGVEVGVLKGVDVGVFKHENIGNIRS